MDDELERNSCRKGLLAQDKYDFVFIDRILYRESVLFSSALMLFIEQRLKRTAVIFLYNFQVPQAQLIA